MAYSKEYIAKQKLIKFVQEQEKRNKRLRQSEVSLREVRRTTRLYRQPPYNPCEGIVMI